MAVYECGGCGLKWEKRDKTEVSWACPGCDSSTISQMEVSYCTSNERKDLELKLENAEKKATLLRAGFRWQVDALETLQEMLGSRNDQNPWLGVTAALSLALNRGDAIEEKYDELHRFCMEEIRPFLNRNAYIGDDTLSRSLVEELVPLLDKREPRKKE